MDLYPHSLRVVKPNRIADPYNPKAGRETLDPAKGATVLPERFTVSCQPLSQEEESETGVRVAVATSWRIITKPGSPVASIAANDGVLVEGVDGVLEVQGEIGGWPFPPLAHQEFIVTRWKG